MRGKNRLALCGVAVLLLTVIGLPAQAGAQERELGDLGGVGASVARFEGRTIDLGEDWGEARACLVWRQGGVMECFRDYEELDDMEARLAPQRPPPLLPEPDAGRSGPTASVAAYSCSSSLRLYEHNWYGGRRLSFWDRGYWQNLADYGFEDRTSSYIVGGCTSYLAEHANGGGWWYPGPTHPYAGEPAMQWGWQDTISSIYVG